LEIKIKSLEENIKLIENNDISKIDLNNSINGILLSKELVDENIKRAKIKELKTNKFFLEEKAYYLETQINELIHDEDKFTKKFDAKVYLENFEKEKKEAEIREHKWRKDQIQRAKKFEEEQLRIQERIREKAESDELYYMQKKQETYQKHLEKIKNKSNVIKEDMNKLNEKKDEWKSNPIDDKQYLFKVAEENFKRKELEEKEEVKNKMVAELAKKKILSKPFEKGELEEYQKKFQEEKNKKNYEKEKERLLKKEELMKKNAEIPKPDTKVYEKIVEEEKKLRENREKEKLDRVYNAMKIKQYSKVVLKSLVPKIDEEKKQDLLERINKQAQSRPEKLTKSKHERIILRKPDPDKPKKYNWELKLESVDEGGKNNKKIRRMNSHNFSKTSHEMEELEYGNDSQNLSGIRKSSEKGKKVPMTKPPDYLTELRNDKMKKLIDPNKVEPGIDTEIDEKESIFN